MDPLQKFIGLLSDICAKHDWIGCQRDGFSLGTFLSYEGVIKGFEIRICQHDYTDVIGKGYSIPRKVLRKRAVSSQSKTWIEMSIHDKIGRFGRKGILSREIFAPEDPQYEAMQNIFAEIERVGHVFVRYETSCLSVEQSLLGICDELAKQPLPI